MLLHYLGGVLVIFGHQFELLGVDAPYICGVKLHSLGLYLLFIISGYLTEGSFERSKGTIDFLKKRFMRIYPPFVICVLVTVLGMLIITEVDLHSYAASAFHYIVDNLRLCINFSLRGCFEQNIYSGVTNGALWTIPIEIACYLTLPLIHKLLLHIKDNISVFVIFIITIIFELIYFYIHFDDFYLYTVSFRSFLHLSPFFFMGVLYKLALNRFCNVKVALLIFFVMVLSTSLINDVAFSSLIVLLLAPYIIISVGELKKIHSFRIDCAYEIYLYGFPIQQLVLFVLGINEVGVLSYGQIFFLAIISFLFISAWALVLYQANHFIIQVIRNTVNKLSRKFRNVENS